MTTDINILEMTHSIEVKITQLGMSWVPPDPTACRLSGVRKPLLIAYGMKIKTTGWEVGRDTVINHSRHSVHSKKN
jgi:hypothetical protein